MCYCTWLICFIAFNLLVCVFFLNWFSDIYCTACCSSIECVKSFSDREKYVFRCFLKCYPSNFRIPNISDHARSIKMWRSIANISLNVMCVSVSSGESIVCFARLIIFGWCFILVCVVVVKFLRVSELIVRVKYIVAVLFVSDE